MNRQSKNCLWILGVLALFVNGAAGVAAQSGPAVAQTLRVIRDIPYFSGLDADATRHSLDLYLPAGKSSVPVMFFVHGGGWRVGDKSADGRTNFIDLCLRQGMGVALINYRLSPAAKHPAHIQDVARAFAWLHKNATQHGVDPNNVFVAGHSAGGHLVALLALDPKYLQAEGISPKSIKGVVAISGVYDLADFYEPGVVPTRMEQAFGTDVDILRAASPSLKVDGASPDTPPFLITYTNNDLFGLAEQAKTFYSLFLRNNIPAQLVEVPARDHFNVVSEVDRQVIVNDINGRPIVAVEDLFGPAVTRFIRTVRDGSLARSFHAVWPKGGPASVANMAPAAMKITKDVRYYEGSGSDPKLNALDLYVPEGKTNVPVLFYVHGGGWRAGDKGTPDTLVHLFGRLGWAVVAVNYRLSPAVKHPTHIQDVARAFAWVYKNGAQHGFDRGRIVISGGSAGAHLVSLLALATKHLEREGVPPAAIKGVISTSGIYDFPKWPEPGKVPTRKEQGFGTDPAVLAEASPITYVTPSAPPFLLTFTDSDLYLLAEEAHRFHTALLKTGVKVRLVQVPDRTHFDYMAGAGRAAIALVDDILAVELVNFATGVVELAK